MCKEKKGKNTQVYPQSFVKTISLDILSDILPTKKLTAGKKPTTLCCIAILPQKMQEKNRKQV